MFLNTILNHKKNEVARLPSLNLAAAPLAPLDFAAMINQARLSVIAELKPKTPSAGVLCANYQPQQLAQAYAAGGADAISVLTDEHYFGGSFNDLQQVRKQVNLPLLCKDFIIDSKQIHLARAHGADACLLIVGMLDQKQLIHLKDEIESLGMAAVIEIFNKPELEMAMSIQPTIIQINNRNLNNFEINLENAHQLCEKIPPEIGVIAASGIKQASDLKQLPARVNAVLIGTALMQSNNPSVFLQALKGAS